MSLQSEYLFPQKLEQCAARRGDKIALIDDSGMRTWAEFFANAQTGALVLTQGSSKLVEPRDRVGVIGSNQIAHVEAIAAIALAGCCLVPLSTYLAPEALGRIIDDASLKVIFATQDCFPLVVEALSHVDRAAPEVILADLRADAENQPARTPIASDQVMRDWDAVIVYSSGTTGLPKGIVHTHAVRAGQMAAFSAFGFDENSKTLLSTPLASNWTLAGLMTTLWYGGCAILMSKFDTSHYFELIEVHRPSFAFLVPTQIERLLRAPQFGDLHAAHVCTKLSAGSPLDKVRKVEFATGWPGSFVEIYSQTEGSVTTTLNVNQRPDKAASVGQPSPGIEVKILRDNDSECAIGEVGAIVGYSPHMTAGYFNRPDATEALYWIAPNGRAYQRTGDLGYIDEDGFVYVVGRDKDMIISGGFNVYPSDLEAVLSGHDAVLEAAVIGVPSQRWGETPLAIVVASQAISSEALMQWANAALGKHQRLAGIEFVDELPRGSLDKVSKKTLREQFKDWALVPSGRE